MLCRKPFMQGSLPFGCGQCLPCRINRRRVWTHRIMLESYKHQASCFVTLTYAPEHLPDGQSLVPRDTQLWLKRLRKLNAPNVIRYFVVGEYGDETQRPHYHAAVFGLAAQPCAICRHQYRRANCDCLLAHSWGLGHVLVGDLTSDSAQYIAGYVTKKMTSFKDERLQGRHPEFSRMSLRPGIGATAMEDVSRVLTTPQGAECIIREGDVPMALKYGKVKQLPLGRYLRSRLRREVGLNEEKVKEDRLRKWSLEVVENFSTLLGDDDNRSKSLAQILVQSTSQKALKQEVKSRIYKQRRSL